MSKQTPFATLTFYLMAAATFFLDQLTKVAIVGALALGHSQPLIDGLFNLTYVRNTGAAFSIFAGHPEKLGMLAVAVALGVMLYQWRTRPTSVLMVLAMGLFLGGALGNAFDRLFHGFVVDMFDLRWQGQNVFPIFNVADIAVNVGVGLFLIQSFLAERAPRRQPS